MEKAASAVQMITLELVVPPGVVPGQMLPVQTPTAGVMLVPIPVGIGAGEKLQFQVPSAPVTATPVQGLR